MHSFLQDQVLSCIKCQVWENTCCERLLVWCHVVCTLMSHLPALENRHCTDWGVCFSCDWLSEWLTTSVYDTCFLFVLWHFIVYLIVKWCSEQAGCVTLMHSGRWIVGFAWGSIFFWEEGWKYKGQTSGRFYLLFAGIKGTKYEILMIVCS